MHGASEVISAERGAAALTWLRSLMAHAPEALDGLELTPVTVQTAEALRTRVEARESAVTTVIADARARERAFHHNIQGARVAVRLEEEALVEVRGLARVCAALELDVRGAASRMERLRVIGELAAAAAEIRGEKASVLSEIAAARRGLKGSAEELRCGREAVALAREGATRRRGEVARDREKARVMVVKATEYEEAAKDFKEKVRSSGVTKHRTHDAVVSLAERLTDLEEQLRVANEQLTSFHDLPPVRMTQLDCPLLQCTTISMIKLTLAHIVLTNTPILLLNIWHSVL